MVRRAVFSVPLPGETALVGAGLLAGSGQLALGLVIAVGTAAAILGDNLGYWFGRRGGRALLMRDGRFANHRRKAVAKSEQFFERHGPKAVFLGRWSPACGSSPPSPRARAECRGASS